MHMRDQGVYGTSVYLPLSLAVNLKLLFKILNNNNNNNKVVLLSLGIVRDKRDNIKKKALKM